MVRLRGDSTVTPKISDLAGEIRRIGFACRRCGLCCRQGQGDTGLVFASRDEVEAIVTAGAGSRDEVACPYPEFIPCGEGAAVTFGWCLRHDGDRCSLLSDHGCTVYRSRPWICRTYPFALVDGELAVSDCPGLGDPISEEDALALAEALIDRARFEAADERRVREILGSVPLPAGRRCVVDSSGILVCDGIPPDRPDDRGFPRNPHVAPRPNRRV